MKLINAFTAILLLFSPQVISSPVTLDGLGIVSQWTDFESTGTSTPDNPWGNSDIVNADRVGFYIEYANGTTGSASYSGIADYWGGCCNLGGNSFGIAYDTATGFFVNDSSNSQYYGNLHGLDNDGFILTAAWFDLRNEFTSNFDIGYENFYNSDWRANSLGGWDWAQITFYSSAVEVSAVPLPAAAWLFGSALLGFFGFSRRKANA